MKDWRPIDGYGDFYQISSCGDVKSLDRIDALGRPLSGKVLKLSPDRDGYLMVTLSAHGVAKKRKVHQLVLETFGSKRAGNKHCCHADGNPANNNIANLRWASAKENRADGVKHGRFPRNWNGAIGTTLVDVERARDLKAAGVGNKKIALWLGLAELTTRRLFIRPRSWWPESQLNQSAGT